MFLINLSEKEVSKSLNFNFVSFYFSCSGISFGGWPEIVPRFKQINFPKPPGEMNFRRSRDWKQNDKGIFLFVFCVRKMRNIVFSARIKS